MAARSSSRQRRMSVTVGNLPPRGVTGGLHYDVRRCNLRVTPRPRRFPLAAQTDRIERHVQIAAPVERVWELITSAEHVGRWFADAGAEIDLRPGGALTLSWREHGTFHGRVEAVEPPRRFAYRWLSKIGSQAEPTPGNSTLTEFTLAAEGGGTRVAVVESGFDTLDGDAAERAAALASHIEGWAAELRDLVTYAAGAPAAR